MEKKYRIELSVEERQELKAMVSRGRAAAYRQTHARILLLSDEAQGDGVMKDGDIARSLQVGRATVERVRRRCVEEGVEAALGRREQLNRRQKKLDGQGEARLVALACAEPTVERVRRRCVEEGVEAPGATQSPSEEVGRSGGSPPGCPGLRRTATGPGKLDA